jgi:hypothetical protein
MAGLRDERLLYGPGEIDVVYHHDGKNTMKGFSLTELSPLPSVPRGHLLTSFKAYFDGAGKADSTLYRSITLGGMSGNGIQWDHFTDQWNRVLKKHGADFLHTTDALSLKGSFSNEKGWDKHRVNDLLTDCVTVLERCCSVRDGDKFTFQGIRPLAVTVILHDYNRALKEYPNIGTVESICVVMATGCATAWASLMGYHKYEFFFDRNDPFKGYLKDRKTNKKAKGASDLMARLIGIGDSNMREIPALQATDLLAWAVSHQGGKGEHRTDWYRRLVAIDRDGDVLDYIKLSEPSLRNRWIRNADDRRTANVLTDSRKCALGVNHDSL